MSRPSASRRTLLGATLAIACARPAWSAAPVPEAATLLAPGPEDGAAAAFAVRATRGLARGLVQAASLRVSFLGGADGITAANRFAAATPADGRLLLLFPGRAAHALLVGDSRARFEPRRWPALVGVRAPALLACRPGLAATQPVRIALTAPAGPEAAGLLAFDLLGRAAAPVFLTSGMAPEAALRAGAADAIVLAGPGARARAAALGLVPWFSFGSRGAGRDGDVADVPMFEELIGEARRPDLLAAVRAATAALGVLGLLVLPALTSADAVALWRDAARKWNEEAQDSESSAHRLGPDDAAAALAELCPPPEVALGYREWLARRLGFRAS